MLLRKKAVEVYVWRAVAGGSEGEIISLPESSCQADTRELVSLCLCTCVCESDNKKKREGKSKEELHQMICRSVCVR